MTQSLIEFSNAIKANDVDKVTEITKDNPDITTTLLPDGSVSLILAAQTGCFDVVKFLVEKYPHLLNITDKNNQTPLLWACSKGFDHIVEYLAEKGADLNIPTVHEELENDIPPIVWAITKGYEKVVASLIKWDVKLDVRWGEDLWHLSHLAINEGYPKIALMLLDADPESIDATDINKNTAISYAISSGDEDLVRELVRRGANLKIHDKQLHYLPVHQAIHHGKLSIFKYLQALMSNENVLVGRNRKDYIHLAVHYGLQDFIEYLIEQDPLSLEKPDKYNATPIFYTVLADDEPTLKLLLAKGANCDVKINKPDTYHHDQTILEYAYYMGSYKVANAILKRAQNETETILKQLVYGGQALELMLDDPNIIPLILQDERLMSLIGSAACTVTDKTINWYQPLKGRRHSLYVNIDKETKKLSHFSVEKVVGTGGFATVRRLKTKDGESIAVKASNDIDYGSNKRKEELNNELKFNQLAYPSDKYASFWFPEKNNSYRFVMPYIDGDSLIKVLPKISCEYQLAELILKIARELLRFHRLGILHRDLHARNIMIYADHQVRFIDFGFSCLLTEENMSYILIEDTTQWWPPEVCTTFPHMPSNLKAHSNQDVYSLGFTLDKHLRRHTCYQTLMTNFPVIGDFIKESMDADPESRPLLEEFCNGLNKALEEHTVALQQSMNKECRFF